jgi:hypothetical protein
MYEQTVNYRNLYFHCRGAMRDCLRGYRKRLQRCSLVMVQQNPPRFLFFRNLPVFSSGCIRVLTTFSTTCRLTFSGTFSFFLLVFDDLVMMAFWDPLGILPISSRP